MPPRPAYRIDHGPRLRRLLLSFGLRISLDHTPRSDGGTSLFLLWFEADNSQDGRGLLLIRRNGVREDLMDQDVLTVTSSSLLQNSG
jgi:hypothetical protein